MSEKDKQRFIFWLPGVFILACILALLIWPNLAGSIGPVLIIGALAWAGWAVSKDKNNDRKDL